MSITMNRSIFFCIFFLLVGAFSGQAAGQTTEADFHFERARELFDAGRHADALEHLLASHRLAPTADLTLTIARTCEYLDRHEAAYNWYETYLSDFELDEAQRSTALRERDPLLARVAVIEVVTEPPDASIFIDRRDLGAVGRAPRRVAVSPGEHLVYARLEAHHEANASATAQQGRIVGVSLALRAMMGRLSVETTPPGATVTAAGRAEPLGVTPFEVELSVGELSLEITLEGHEPLTRQVTILDARDVDVSLELSPAASTLAVLSVVSEPGEAMVLLDGDEVGQTPLSLSGLTPGRRRLEVDLAGRTPYAAEVLLEAGAATRVEASLADPDDRLWSGWRWIGYGGGGGLVAAGGVLGVMALVHRGHFFESDNPSRELLDRVRAEGLAADILLGVGLVTAAVVLVFDIVRGRAAQSTATLTIDR